MDTISGHDIEIEMRNPRRSISGISLESLDLEMRRPHRRDSYELGRAAVLTPRTRRSSFGSLGELRLHLSRPEEPVPSIEVNPELSVYPSSVAPPSYNNVRHDIDGYQPSFTNPPILSGTLLLLLVVQLLILVIGFINFLFCIQVHIA